MKFISTLALILLACASSGAETQRPLTLAEAEAIALENNPEIGAVRSRIPLAEARADGAGAFDDPEVMYRNWGVPLFQPWNVTQSQQMFMFTQKLPGPGKRDLRYLAAAQGVDIAEIQVQTKRRQVAAEVRAAFYRLLRTYDQLRLHGELAELAHQGFATARIKYTVGAVPQQDVLKAQIAISKLVEDHVMFDTEGEMARAELNTLMGRDPSAPLEVTGDYTIPARLPAFEQVKELALRSRPELMALEAAIRQAGTNTRLAEKAYTPDLWVGAGYMIMPPGTPMRNTYMAEVSMNLPWLNRSKHDAEIREAHSELNAMKAEYRNVVTQIGRQIQEALIRAESARRLVDVYKNTLRPQARTTLNAAAAAYQTDQTDFLNLLDSQGMTIDVEHAYFRALTDYEVRLAELELAIGAELPRGERQ